MPERPRGNKPATPWQIGLERLLLPFSCLVILVMTIGVHIFSWGGTHGFTLLGFLAVGLLANHLVSLLRRRGVATGRINTLSAAIHGGLSILGVLATGGVDSPIAPLFTLALATIPLRFPTRQAVSIGIVLTALFFLGALLAGQKNYSSLGIFSMLNLLSLLMLGSLVRRNEVYTARFLQTAAHELRNPMAVVKGLLSLLRRRLAAGQPVGDLGAMTATMEREVDRLSALIDETLEAFLLKEGQLPIDLAPLSLKETVIKAMEPFQVAEGAERVILDAVEEAGACVVLGDRHRLIEVVHNLVGNALKHSPGSMVRIALRAANGKAVLEVRDNGPGIPRAATAQIFNPFFRRFPQERDPGGMGLGLFICQNLIQRHGGRIWVESEPGRGAAFMVELPLHVIAAGLSRGTPESCPP